ncbi:hypothetical protein [uncultured Deefgea sp.]|uniref:hypothetical protein n=1 Tax=uncultured Deefgea sp. TaxID=1304914 RepID=UPI00262DC662|nr:hypothetical protein [uncultured Deefgea sp.]
MNYDMDSALYRPAPRSKFIPALLVVCLLCSSLLLWAYFSGRLPHYTIMVRGNTLELVRDDPAHLSATLPAPVVADDPQDLFVSSHPEETYIERDATLSFKGLPAQEVKAPNPNQIYKCKTAAGSVVYQQQDCISTGHSLVEVLFN